MPAGQLTVAAADTKVLARASKHSAASYQRAGEMIELPPEGGRGRKRFMVVSHS